MHCQFGSQHSTGFWESPLELVLEMSLYSKSKYFHHGQYTLAVVIDAGELLLIAAHMLAHHLVEVVVLVGILFALGGTALLQQVAQRIVGVGIGEGIVGIDLQPAGAAGEPVQRIIGKGCAALEIFRSVAVPLELRQHIALGVVGVLILDLGRFVVELEGIGVHRLEEIALRVIGILLDPAVGIGQLDRAVGSIVSF